MIKISHIYMETASGLEKLPKHLENELAKHIRHYLERTLRHQAKIEVL